MSARWVCLSSGALCSGRCLPGLDPRPVFLSVVGAFRGCPVVWFDRLTVGPWFFPGVIIIRARGLCKYNKIFGDFRGLWCVFVWILWAVFVVGVGVGSISEGLPVDASQGCRGSWVWFCPWVGMLAGVCVWVVRFIFSC